MKIEEERNNLHQKSQLVVYLCDSIFCIDVLKIAQQIVILGDLFWMMEEEVLVCLQKKPERCLFFLCDPLAHPDLIPLVLLVFFLAWEEFFSLHGVIERLNSVFFGVFLTFCDLSNSLVG